MHCRSQASNVESDCTAALREARREWRWWWRRRRRAPARKQYLPKTGRKSGCRWGSEICHVAKGVCRQGNGCTQATIAALQINMRTRLQGLWSTLPGLDPPMQRRSRDKRSLGFRQRACGGGLSLEFSQSCARLREKTCRDVKVGG
jgi:hypothetical protein